MSKRKYAPQNERERQDYLGGKESFESGLPIDVCPFFYKAVGYPPQDEFEKKYRIRLELWTQGWLDARDKSNG